MLGLNHRQNPKQGVLKGMVGKLLLAVGVVLICYLSFMFSSSMRGDATGSDGFLLSIVEKLWETADSGGWRPPSAPRAERRSPPSESNGYLRVRSNGGLYQQRSASSVEKLGKLLIQVVGDLPLPPVLNGDICNAVLAARIMNAVLVMPELDASSFWHDEGGFQGIYDVEHFIKTLRYDVKIVEKIPDDHKNGKGNKIKAYQLRPPRDAPISWYLTTALEKMKEHGAIYLTSFSHRLAEEIDNPEYQRLRCRVNYHALRFKPRIMKLSKGITDELRSQGHFMSIHLRFEIDMLAFAGCFDIFTPEEQKILKKYREENFAKKRLVPSERSAIGKCPLTPGEVALLLRAMGFDNSTRIYLAAGEIIGGERYMKPFRVLFPHLENHSSVDPSEELVENMSGIIGSVVDYMVCLLSDIFMPTYDGPSNFTNNLLGHRLYYGFRTTIRPGRKSLAPFFLNREKGREAGFEAAVKPVMSKTNFGGPHTRVSPESFYTNSWPECFCQNSSTDPAHKCPPENVMEILDSQLGKEADN